MSITRNVLNAEYRLLRAPASLFERKVLSRLPEQSVIRLGAEGGLAVADALAGRITGNDEVGRRGRTMIDSVTASLRARWDDRNARLLGQQAENEVAQPHKSSDGRSGLSRHDVAAAVDDSKNDQPKKAAKSFNAGKTSARKSE